MKQKLCEMSFYDFFSVKLENSRTISALYQLTGIINIYVTYYRKRKQERIIEGRPKTKDIVINVPFRSTKSLITTVLFPVWCWIRDPKLRFITSCLFCGTVYRTRNKSRDVIQSDWFKERWGEIFNIKKDQNLKS